MYKCMRAWAPLRVAPSWLAWWMLLAPGGRQGWAAGGGDSHGCVDLMKVWTMQCSTTTREEASPLGSPCMCLYGLADMTSFGAAVSCCLLSVCRPHAVSEASCGWLRAERDVVVVLYFT